jgi:hypothetical protein
MPQKIKLSQLSQEDRDRLVKEAIKEQEGREQAKAENRKKYKKQVHKAVPTMFKKLEAESLRLSKLKEQIFNSAKSLIEKKQEVFGVKQGQQSHTFSNEDSTQSITIGYRIIDGWDDTLPTGISKVNNFLATLSTNAENEKLVNAINRLLQKDANGNLKSSRVLELEKIAEDFNSPLLNDGIGIIRKAYKPKKTCYFIEASKTDATGKKQGIPLSISTVDFPEGIEVEFI